MAKELIRKVGKYAILLYRDNINGIAWIEDGSAGIGHSCHPNISASGSVAGMKKLGYWGKLDKTVQSHGFKYNISKFVIDIDNNFDNIVANECMCQECLRRNVIR